MKKTFFWMAAALTALLVACPTPNPNPPSTGDTPNALSATISAGANNFPEFGADSFYTKGTVTITSTSTNQISSAFRVIAVRQGQTPVPPSIGIGSFTSTPNNTVWDTSSVAEGQYSIQVDNSIASPSNVLSKIILIAVDRTAPAISSLEPLNAATMVSAGQQIVATLSEVIDPSALGGVTLTVNGSGATATVVVGTGSQSAIIITPTVAIAAGAAVSVGLTGVKDRAGNTLASTPWSWTVQP